MKHIIHILRTISLTVIILSTTLLLFGCDSYLNELPDNRTELDNSDKIYQLLGTAYPNESYAPINFSMSDNSTYLSNFISLSDLLTNKSMYYWEDFNNTIQTDAPNNYWNACYTAIAVANEALSKIEASKAIDLTAAKGEALVARAYAHFMLVNLYAKTYDPSTAGSDLGIPYVEEVENVVFKEYTRISVKEVYDNVERDLLEGMKLISDEVYKTPKFHFNKKAAYAFASRFYLYKGDWDNVINYSSLALGANPSLVIRDWAEIRNLTFTQTGIRLQSSEEVSNLLITSTGSLHARNYAQYRYGISSQLLDKLFDAVNPTGHDWAYPRYSRYSGLTNFIPKYREYFKFINITAGIGNVYVMNVLFTQDEALLNRAEAFVMKNNFDAATTDLNTFFSKKSQSYVTTTDVRTAQQIETSFAGSVVPGELTPFYTLGTKQEIFIKGILNLRRLEFLHEGLRWFDNRRFRMKIIHLDEDGNEKILEKEDLRKQLQIPQDAIDSSGLKPNPR